MNYFSDPSLSTSYQFSRWSPSLIRPSSNKSDKNILKSTSNHQCSSFIESRSHSPPLLYQPAPTPDLYVIDEQSSSVSSITPVRIKSATLTIPLKTNSEEIILTNFAKQSHERRKLALERKLRKQQVQKYAHMDSDIWFHLRQSSIPLKRLTKTDEGQNTLQQLPINCEKLEQNEKKSDFKSTPILRPRTSIPKSSTSASQTATKTYSESTFQPFFVAAKPLHPLLITNKTHSSKPQIKFIKPPSSAPPRMRSSPQTPLPPSPSLTTPETPPIIEEKPLDSSPIISESLNRPKTASLKSTIKLQNQIPRCRSATDTKSLSSLNNFTPRFILITDDEHRIECWYHRYPFIISTDLLQSFQSKSSSLTISAYFTDDSPQSIDFNRISKGHLQPKPFHRDTDWKKYDLIFISEKIYQDVMIYLQTIVNLIHKLSGKFIPIHRVNQQEDLKTQVTHFCKQIGSNM